MFRQFPVDALAKADPETALTEASPAAVVPVLVLPADELAAALAALPDAVFPAAAVAVAVAFAPLADKETFAEAVADPFTLAVGLTAPLPAERLADGSTAEPDMNGPVGSEAGTKFGVLAPFISTNVIAAATASTPDATTACHSRPDFPRST